MVSVIMKSGSMNVVFVAISLHTYILLGINVSHRILEEILSNI